VLDPFSGRGTTPLEACIASRIGIGSDANPLAAVLTTAKVKPATLDRALMRVQSLRSQYQVARPRLSAPPEIQMLFDGRRTLPQLLFLRNTLSRKSHCDTFLLATLCGILHGNHAKESRSSRTLSISMPNTFSMSPAYIKRFKRAHRLKKYPFDVFDSLERRLRHLFRDTAPALRGFASERDARTITSWLRKDSIALVVTSPPYLRLVRYGKFNWIRLWMLNASVEGVDARLRVEATDNNLRLSDQLRFPAYCTFLGRVLKQCESVLRPGGFCVLVLGDITNSKDTLNLGWNAWKVLRGESALKFVDLVDDAIVQEGKVTRIWGKRRGSATKTDRILVLRKPGGPRRRYASPEAVMASLKTGPD
jgi:hypothetical protein